MISDLPFIETVYPSGSLTGGIYAWAGGNVATGYGYSSAGTFATAIGPQTLTIANTSASTFLTPYYTTANANGVATAFASNGSSYASASYYGSSNFTSFSGNSMSLSVEVQSLTIRYR